jgi:hypothetical protein
MVGSVYRSVCGAAISTKFSELHDRENVESLGKTTAVLANMDTGALKVVARASLPKGVHEGDVLVDGKVDPVERLLLEQRIRELQSSFQPVGSLEL